MESSVRRHAAAHLPTKLALAARAEEATEADDLHATARRVQREALDVLETAKANGNLGGVLQAADRIQKGCALLATLTERGVGQEREFVISWKGQDDPCPDCGHDPKACKGGSGREGY